MISVVVVDDHPLVLHGVANVLRSNSEMTVVAACDDGLAAMKAVEQLAPTVAVLDILMPGLTGLDVLAGIAAQRSMTKVVFLTATANDEQLLTCVARGAKGIVLKEAALSELVECIQAVAAGGHWLPLELIEAARQREASRKSLCRLIASLTWRERQITLMVVQALSNKEIGRRLNLSEGTVKIHLHNIYQKIGVSNRTALTAIALREQLLFPDELTADLPGWVSRGRREHGVLSRESTLKLDTAWPNAGAKNPALSSAIANAP